MSQGYGVDSDGNIRRVWLRHLPGAAGTAFGDLTIRVPATGKREVSVSHALWTWNATDEEADPPVAVAEAVVPGAAVTKALHTFLDMCGSVWMLELELYPTVKTFGQGALRIGMQAGINYAGDTTYSEAIRVKGLLNAAEGTADNPSINSGRTLARNADQIIPANRVLPEAMFLWVNRATGEKLTLPAALGVTWGTLDANFQLYSRPTVTA